MVAKFIMCYNVQELLSCYVNWMMNISIVYNNLDKANQITLNE